MVNVKKYDLDEMTQQINRAARVVTGWVRDTDFHTKRGQPKDLVFEDEAMSFSELVKRYSGDVPARAIADELLRVGVIENTILGKLKLREKAYIPGKDIDKKIKILGDDVSDLIKTISHNIQKDSDITYFQRKVFYNSVPKESLEKIRGKINRKAQSSLEDIDKVLVKHDSDMNKKLNEKGKCRVGVGIYYFEEVNDEV